MGRWNMRYREFSCSLLECEVQGVWLLFIGVRGTGRL